MARSSTLRQSSPSVIDSELRVDHGFRTAFAYTCDAARGSGRFQVGSGVSTPSSCLADTRVAPASAPSPVPLNRRVIPTGKGGSALVRTPAQWVAQPRTTAELSQAQRSQQGRGAKPCSMQAMSFSPWFRQTALPGHRPSLRPLPCPAVMTTRSPCSSVLEGVKRSACSPAN